MKILILGGYGVFGGRLSELIAGIPGLDVLIAGRSVAKARASCAGRGNFRPVQVDRDDIASALAEHEPDLLVDASGPFQDYGEAPYVVVKACIAAGVNYLDFADGADFVAGIAQFNAGAQDAGVFVRSGVSSFPVLTAAVLQHFEQDMTVETVEGGIAPSPYAGVGMNVMRAVVGYAGNPVPLMRDGAPGKGIALAESRYFTIAPPGKMPLRNIRFSLVEVPELQVLPREMPDLADIWMGAGPGPEGLHRMLNGLAKLRYRLKLPPMTWLAPFCYRVLNLLKFGEHRGGMYIQVSGTVKSGADAGQPVMRSWHMLAEGDDGPYVPSMAIEALIQKVLAGEPPAIGARPATGALTLAEYDILFASRQIFTGFREDGATGPLYRKVLEGSYDKLPEQVRKLHGSNEKRRWSGQVEARAGQNVFARLAAKLSGFPTKDFDGPVSVTFTPDDRGELWERDFGGYKFRTWQTPGQGRNAGLLVEQFGGIHVALAMVVRDGRLYLIPRRSTFLGIPLPKFLLPGGDSFEYEADGRFHFDVAVHLPLIGQIVGYRGWLIPD